MSNHILIRLIRFVFRFTVHLCNAIYFSTTFSTACKRFKKNWILHFGIGLSPACDKSGFLKLLLFGSLSMFHATCGAVPGLRVGHHVRRWRVQGGGTNSCMHYIRTIQLLTNLCDRSLRGQELSIKGVTSNFAKFFDVSVRDSEICYCCRLLQIFWLLIESS